MKLYPHLTRILAVGPTLPSQTPPFDVLWDEDGKVYYLQTDYGNGKGDCWSITPTGDSEYLGEVKRRGPLVAGPHQTLYHDYNFVDYVGLKVIQEIYGLIDPNFEQDEDYDGAGQS